MLEIKRAHDFSVQFYGIHLPMGALYTIFPARNVNGRFMPKSYVWVDNIHACANMRYFPVHILSRDDVHPRVIRVDGARGVWHELKEYARQIPPCNRSVNYGKVMSDRPKDRKVGQYVMRGRPSYDTAPNVSTQKFVTDGCKVGPNFYTDEGYWGEVMHMGAPSFR